MKSATQILLNGIQHYLCSTTSFFKDFTFPYGFHSPGDYEKWLAQVGLKAKRIELIPKDTRHKGKEKLAGWVRTTWLPYTERVPENMRESFISDFADA
ncbi:MAG: hypothetical protein GY749_21980 [Desulfobacteraceae bacterium]|nr:hypothetical protein [Desulfobacteraceae bacterium]